MIEQVGGPLGHPAASATRTHRAARARKRDAPGEAAVAAAKPREPAGEPATPKEVPDLLLDEARQADRGPRAAFRPRATAISGRSLPGRLGRRPLGVRPPLLTFPSDGPHVGAGGGGG